MNINKTNNINFGISKPKPQKPKLYTRAQALDILLDKYAEADNKIKQLKKEQDDYFDSIPSEEFDRPMDNPVLNKWTKYFSEIQFAKLEKAGVEVALDKVVKLPSFVKVKFKSK